VPAPHSPVVVVLAVVAAVVVVGVGDADGVTLAVVVVAGAVVGVDDVDDVALAVVGVAGAVLVVTAAPVATVFPLSYWRRRQLHPSILAFSGCRWMWHRRCGGGLGDASMMLAGHVVVFAVASRSSVIETAALLSFKALYDGGLLAPKLTGTSLGTSQQQ
jgi:hypothetical protein